MENVNVSNGGQVSKFWVLFSGIVLTCLGLYVFNNPALAIVSATYYIGFAKVISGGVGIGGYFANRGEAHGKMLLPLSIIDLLFGLFLLVSPIFKLTLIVMAPYYFGAWAFVRGLALAFTSFSNRKNIDHWILQMIMGVFYVIVGIYFFTNPLISFFSLLAGIGMMLIIMGISTLIQFVFLLFKRK